MFKLNLKIAWRNLWKNKTYTAINLFGLATGLAGFILILLYINHETGFDKWDPALKRTYIVSADFTQNGTQNKGTKIKGLLSTVLKQTKEVEEVSIGSLNQSRFEFKKEEAGNVLKSVKATSFIDSNFFNTYPLKADLGRMDDVFTAENAIAISRTMAEELFGDEDPINKVILKTGGANFPDRPLVIKAVWDDKKQASTFGFDLLLQDDFKQYGNQLLSTTFTTLFKLREGVDAKETIARINDAYIIEMAKFSMRSAGVRFKPSTSEALALLKEREGITSFKLVTSSLDELNLSGFYSNNVKMTTIYVLISLAGFLIVISCINYTNLALVMAQSRAKEVGVKKVMGAFRMNLLKQFFAEAAIQCVLAFLVALILVELALPQVNALLPYSLSFIHAPNSLQILLQSLLIVLGIILLSGTYPAIVLAGFRPVKVLKGNFNHDTGIGRLRKMLVVFQFTLAIALVISFGVIYAQVEFMKNKDLGLKSSDLLSFRVAKYSNRVLSPANFESIKRRLLAIKGIEEVTRSTEAPINDSGFADDISYGNTTLNMESRYVDPDYLDVIGAKLLMGRSFSYERLGTDSVQSLILNETAFKKLGLDAVNKTVSLVGEEERTPFQVVGVVKDIQVYGFNQAIVPTVYLVNDYPMHWRTTIILRLNTVNVAETMSALKALWKEIEPAAEPQFSFVDDVIETMNKNYETSKQIIFAFGLVTILVSVFGLIGFAAYQARLRVKEIAIRKILGASVSALLQLLNKDFIKLVAIATLLADVLAYIYMQKWFSGFAYRIDMPYLIFIGVNAVILLITVLTICFQSIRAVKANPANALKYE